MSNNLNKSESRITIIDSIRGFSFIPMFIFHLYSTYDLVNSFNTSTASTPFISFLGLIRNVFILLAGISLGLSSHYKKGIKYYTSRLKRSVQILIQLCGHKSLVLWFFISGPNQIDG